MPLRLQPLPLNNACAISATLALQPHLDQALVVEVFRKHGYCERTGTPGYATVDAFIELGIQFEEVQGRPLTKTVREFCRRYPAGAFYVVVPGHALAVINGVPLDPYYGRVRARSVVLSAKRILSNVDMVCDQAPRRTDKVVLLVNHNPSSRGTCYSWPFVGASGSPFHTVGEILGSCAYTLADLQWDLKAGYISLQRG